MRASAVISMLIMLIIFGFSGLPAQALSNPVGCYYQDPGPVEYRGDYYLYQSTGISVVLHMSRDLVHWVDKGPVFTQPEGHTVWAPEMHVVNGLFYMYYSDIGPVYKLRLATATNPRGPFTPMALEASSAIDPSLFVASTGDMFLLGSGMAGNNGSWFSELWVWKLSNPITLAPGVSSMVVSRPERGWEGWVNEGPMALERKGQCYLFYSAWGADQPDYCIAYLKTPISNLTSWAQGLWFKPWGNPILKKRGPGPNPSTSPCGGDPGVWGPGHGGVVRGLNGIEQWYVYHRKRFNNTGWDRDLAIDRLLWMRPNYASGEDIGDLAIIDGPTDSTDAEPALDPAPAAFSDCFDANGNVGNAAPGWTYLSGTWKTTADGSLSQIDATSPLKLAVAGSQSRDLIVEAWVKMPPPVSSAKAGVCCYGGPGGTVLFGVGTAGAAPKAFMKTANTAGWVALAPLSGPVTYTFTRYHRLSIEKENGWLSFYLDGRRVGSANGYEGPARGGLFSELGVAEFDGFRSTIGYTDTFEGAAIGWADSARGKTVLGNWHIQELKPAGSLGQPEWRVLRQDDLGVQGGNWKALFRAGMAPDYELSAGISQIGAGDTTGYPKCGFYSCYYDEDNYSVVFLDAQYRVLATYGRVDGKLKNWQNADLPSDYDSANFNTLRVVKQGSTQKFYVNNQLLQTRTFDIAQGQVGLVTEDARADYDDITYYRFDDPASFDQDNDGVPDIRDNAPLIPNADQADTNGNGTGDVGEFRVYGISQIKSLPAGSAVEITDAVLTRTCSDRAYIEDPSRTAGIAVMNLPESTQDWTRLRTLRGFTGTTPQGEPCLTYFSAIPDGELKLGSLGITGRTITSAPDVSGLLVRICGKITGAAPSFSLTDSSLTPLPILPNSPIILTPNSFAACTGIISQGENGIKVIRVTGQEDITSF